MVRRITDEEFHFRIFNKHGDTLYCEEEYRGSMQLHLFSCSICGYSWSTTADSIINAGTGCSHCSGVRKLTHSEFVLKLKSVHKGSIISVGKYAGANISMEFQCTICLHTWKTSPSHILRGSFCPICANKNRHGAYHISNYPEKLFIYLVRVDNFLKVGLSKNPPIRLTKLKYEAKASSIEVLYCKEWSGLKAVQYESYILSTFPRYYPLTKFSGHTECLNIINQENILRELTNYGNTQT